MTKKRKYFSVQQNSQIVCVLIFTSKYCFIKVVFVLPLFHVLLTEVLKVATNVS